MREVGILGRERIHIKWKEVKGMSSHVKSRTGIIQFPC
jgi:hypothetical protein